ncbi:hypothetical protein ACQKKL_28415, partial [Escherichia coli]|uniref:hypothetical protein n=1 Tax=Escherichia coli TaxID=562 RepID=UPI003D014F30
TPLVHEYVQVGMVFDENNSQHDNDYQLQTIIIYGCVKINLTRARNYERERARGLALVISIVY